MKHKQHMKLKNTICIMTLMLLIGCSSNVIDEDDLIEKASLTVSYTHLTLPTTVSV